VTPDADRDSAGSIFLRFLRFGATAWGGPAAQIARLKHEYVDEEGWVSEEAFGKTLAVYQVLPGPEATELCIYLGRSRHGKLAGLLAGLGFVLPGFLLMLALSILYVEASLADNVDELLYGLRAAVAALVAIAVLRLGRAYVTDVPLALIAVAAFALTLGTGIPFVILLVGAGLAYELWTNAERWMSRAQIASPVPVLIAVVAGGITISLTAQVFLEGLKAGLLTFGGAYTVIPFLKESAVSSHHWLTDGQFVDGLALSGALPAPLIIFSTFVGYLTDGLPGALAMTVGIFLPAFVFPLLLHRRLVAVAENDRIRPFLLGVTAAVVGLIAAVTIQILDTSVVDVPTAILALISFAVLYRFHGRLTIVLVVLGCGVAGALLQLTVV
jgi:chromate transporter